MSLILGRMGALTLVITFVFLTSGCYAEFDLSGKIPRRDPCTGRRELEVVYLMPTCRSSVPAGVVR